MTSLYLNFWLHMRGFYKSRDHAIPGGRLLIGGP